MDSNKFVVSSLKIYPPIWIHPVEELQLTIVQWERLQVDISYKVKTIVLADYYTLMDVAYIYTWKRVSQRDRPLNE